MRAVFWGNPSWLNKETLIITGAAGGMGRAICGRLSSLYDVIAVDHHPEKLPGEVAQSVRTVKAELSARIGWRRCTTAGRQGGCGCDQSSGWCLDRRFDRRNF